MKSDRSLNQQFRYGSGYNPATDPAMVAAQRAVRAMRWRRRWRALGALVVWCVTMTALIALALVVLKVCADFYGH